MKIIAEQERSLKKLEKRKVIGCSIQYMEPKYAELLAKFKRDVAPEPDI